MGTVDCPFLLCTATLPGVAPEAVQLVRYHELVYDGTAMTCPGSLMPVEPSHDGILLLGQQAATLLRREPRSNPPRTGGGGYRSQPLGRAATDDRESYFPARS